MYDFSIIYHGWSHIIVLGLLLEDIINLRLLDKVTTRFNLRNFQNKTSITICPVFENLSAIEWTNHDNLVLI